MAKGVGEGLRTGIDTAKSAMALIRDLALALVVLLLLAWPATVAGRLEKAGFTEIGGIVRWQTRIKDSSQALASLTEENANLKRQLAENDIKLQELAQKVGPGAVARIVPLRQENARVQTAASRAAATAVAAVADNQGLLADASKGAVSSARWAVVVGGDTDLSKAQHEANRASEAGLPGPRIYLRRGSYRTISIIPEGTETGAVLDAAREKVRPDSYPVRLNTWCPNPVEKPGHFVCA